MNNNIAESYVSFEVAKFLKEKGFDVKCRKRYLIEKRPDLRKGDTIFSDYPLNIYEIYCPTQQLIIEWLRVNFGIWVDIGWKVTNQEWSDEKPSSVEWWYMISKQIGNPDKTENNEYFYSSPQEAFEEGIKYTLKNLI